MHPLERRFYSRESKKSDEVKSKTRVLIHMMKNILAYIVNLVRLTFRSSENTRDINFAHPFLIDKFHDLKKLGLRDAHSDAHTKITVQ